MLLSWFVRPILINITASLFGAVTPSIICRVYLLILNPQSDVSCQYSLIQTLFSVSSSQLLEVPSGKLLATLIGHTKTVLHCKFSHDGQTLITSSEDTTIRVKPNSTSLKTLGSVLVLLRFIIVSHIHSISSSLIHSTLFHLPQPFYSLRSIIPPPHPHFSPPVKLPTRLNRVLSPFPTCYTLPASLLTSSSLHPSSPCSTLYFFICLQLLTLTVSTSYVYFPLLRSVKPASVHALLLFSTPRPTLSSPPPPTDSSTAALPPLSLL